MFWQKRQLLGIHCGHSQAQRTVRQVAPLRERDSRQQSISNKSSVSAAAASAREKADIALIEYGMAVRVNAFIENPDLAAKLLSSEGECHRAGGAPVATLPGDGIFAKNASQDRSATDASA